MKHLVGFAEKELWNVIMKCSIWKWVYKMAGVYNFSSCEPYSGLASTSGDSSFSQDVSDIVKSHVCSLTSPHKIFSLYSLEVLPMLEVIYCMKKGSGPWKLHE